MSDDIDDDDDTNNTGPDPFAVALQLCAIAAKPATIAAALKKLRKLGRDIETAEARLVAVQRKAAEIVSKMEADVGALDARDRALTQREDAFTASLQEARDNLAAYYGNIAEADRHIRYRILSHAGLLGGFNERLQDLPDWPAIRRLVVGLPDDPPPLDREAVPRIDALSDTFSEPHADRHGNVFLGTLTRDVSHKDAA
jgi:hypothetical protein